VKIVDEFEYAVEKYDSDSIYLLGDNINFDEIWFSNLCGNIIKRDLDIKWICSTMNPINLNEKILDNMRDSGCVRAAAVGFESGSQKMLNNLNKKHYDVNKYESIVKLFNRCDIDILPSFILGAPGETDETLEDTVRFIEKSDFGECLTSILTPLPGSAIFKKVIDGNPHLRNSDLFDMTELIKNYVKYFCDVEYETLMDIKNKISSISHSTLEVF